MENWKWFWLLFSYGFFSALCFCILWAAFYTSAVPVWLTIIYLLMAGYVYVRVYCWSVPQPLVSENVIFGAWFANFFGVNGVMIILTIISVPSMPLVYWGGFAILSLLQFGSLYRLVKQVI